jgi:multidrug efflux pump subunit AcrA (membrane-fusion protein)
MATKTLPRRGFGLSRRWIAGIVLIIVIGAVALSVMNPRSTSQVSAANTVVVTRSSIVGSVSGSGLVTAEQTLDLAFQTSGTVTQVLVNAGDTVTPGQVLARLDDRAWQAQVANAQAALDSAKARLQQAQQGNAKPEDIAAAQAQLDRRPLRRRSCRRTSICLKCSNRLLLCRDSSADIQFNAGIAQGRLAQSASGVGVRAIGV